MKWTRLPLLCCALLFPSSEHAEDGTFVTRLYPVLQKANCRACHVAGGLAGSTRLHFPPPDATPEQIENFGRGLGVLVDRAAPHRSTLLMKPTNRVKHTGGQLIQPGGPDEAAL